MAHSFNVYIDESGDDGMAKFRGAGDGGGASNWLAVGACVVRSSRDLELVALRDRIRQECRPRSSKREIHFKDFNHNQKHFRGLGRVAPRPMIASPPAAFRPLWGFPAHDYPTEIWGITPEPSRTRC